jgi:hypothetical protein
MIRNKELYKFALKFTIAAGISLVILYFLFPFYRSFLGYSVGFLYHLANIKSPISNAPLFVMPFVVVSSLALATPNKGLWGKTKFLLLTYVSFYLIDIFFISLQVFFNAYSAQILVAQDFFTLFGPTTIWLSFSYKSIGIFFEKNENEIKI